MKTVRKNEIVTVKHILGETAEALVTKVDHNRFMFNCDAYVKGETCKGGFFHLRQAREVIPGKKLGNNIKFWPRLRKALHVAGVESVNIPGGDFPIHYCDEVVVPDYKMSGAFYFIIKKDEIGKYLEGLPLDEAGKERARRIEEHLKAEAEEAYRQAHDPICIAERIGNKIWANMRGLEGEFTKITLVSDDGEEFSIMYPNCKFNLAYRGYKNEARVICEAPKEQTGVDYLTGEAGGISPLNHSRIESLGSSFGDKRAYLMPNPELATVIKKTNRWLGLFDNDGNDGVPASKIAEAQRIIIEGYDIYDKLVEDRYVYYKDSDEAVKEHLHNWPFDSFGRRTEEPLDWQPTEV